MHVNRGPRIVEWLALASFALALGVGCRAGGSDGGSSRTGTGGGAGLGAAAPDGGAADGAGAPANGTGGGGVGAGGLTGSAGSGPGAGGQVNAAGGGGGALATAPGALVPTRLRAELRENPLGIQTATPRLAWEIEATDPRARGVVQGAYEVLVASSADKLAADQGDLWSSGVVVSPDSSTVYAGQALGSLMHAVWKVRVRDGAGGLSAWSAPAEWTVGLLAPADWGAQWITGGSAAAGAPLPIFRRELQITKPVARALLAVCGLGQFEVRINGVNPSDAVMEPSWTSYTKTCHYATYDVSQALTPGANAMAVLLGNGMYNVPASNRYAKFTGSFGAPKLIARLAVEYTDGMRLAVVSDTSWKAAPGPITFSNIYGGEDFDARLEPLGWDKPGFSDAAWTAATIVAGAGPALVARSAPPVKVMQEFMPAAVTQPQLGVFVFDLGQNFAGWAEITVQGVAGAAVRMTPAELLGATGTVTQANVGSPVWYTFTPRTAGLETWHPRFAYTGFRYVQVEGAVPAAQAASLPGRPQVVSLIGKFLHASAENVGTFTSSDPDLNAIHALILAAIRSNLQNVLTDCPQREKLGWLEVSHLLAPSIAYDYDVAAFYEKIIRDMSDAQAATGLITDIAPEYPVFAGDFRDSPEWGSAFVIAPWFVYQTYGDRQPLDEQYASMKRYVAYLGGRAVQNIVAYGLGDWYDLGPNPPGVSQLTSAGVTATAIWAQDLAVLQQAAGLLGKADEAAQFQATATAVTGAFNARFLSASGTYDRNSQTANGMPLALGLVPAAQRAAVLASVVASVISAQNRVTAGDIGFVYLLRALTEAGRGDVVYGMLKQSTGPGYLYQINHGATALTEAWDARASSSQNHAMLGHAEEWLYRGLAGIGPDPSGPGFKRFVVRPQPQAGLTSVAALYHSIHGVIGSGWQRGPTGITLSVDVPVNTTATVTVPTTNPGAVTESGAPAASAPGVVAATPMSASLVVQVGSGHYVFTAP